MFQIISRTRSARGSPDTASEGTGPAMHLPRSDTEAEAPRTRWPRTEGVTPPRALIIFQDFPLMFKSRSRPVSFRVAGASGKETPATPRAKAPRPGWAHPASVCVGPSPPPSPRRRSPTPARLRPWRSRARFP